jgi:hypothetical protein
MELMKSTARNEVSLRNVDCHYRRKVKTIMAIARMMDATNTSETSFNFYQTTRRNIPEDGHLLGNVCFETLRKAWEDNINKDLRETSEDRRWLELSQNRVK